jgi:hypothetical protein
MKKHPQDPPENKPMKSMSLTKNLKDRLYEKGKSIASHRVSSRHSSIGQAHNQISHVGAEA